MANKDLIKSIVDTYDLSPGLEGRIIRIANRNVDELFIEGFDNIYRYIAHLIEKFQFPYKKLSLDGLVTSNSHTTFHDIIGIEDPNLVDLFEEEISEPTEKLPIDEAISILEGQIGKQNLEQIQQLATQAGSERYLLLDVSPEDIITNASKIKERLELLKKRYEKGGKLLLPKRPIIQVKFDPSLLIKFGRRNYNGSRLAFYMKYKDIYGGKTRTELFYFDPPFYESLRTHKELHIAIPKKVRDTYRDCSTPLVYFFANPEKYKGRSRTELRKFDEALYRTLLRHKQMDEAIPKKKKSSPQRLRTTFGLFCKS